MDRTKMILHSDVFTLFASSLGRSSGRPQDLPRDSLVENQRGAVGTGARVSFGAQQKRTVDRGSFFRNERLLVVDVHSESIPPKAPSPCTPVSVEAKHAQ